MPKNLTPAMRAHLDEETTWLAAIWRITRKDGAELFFTDHDRDIVLGGDTYQFTGSEALDEAYVPLFGAFGAAWDDAMVARWSANPLGRLWPERDAVFLAGDGGGGGPPAAIRRPVVVIAAG